TQGSVSQLRNTKQIQEDSWQPSADTHRRTGTAEQPHHMACGLTHTLMYKQLPDVQNRCVYMCICVYVCVRVCVCVCERESVCVCLCVSMSMCLCVREVRVCECV